MHITTEHVYCDDAAPSCLHHLFCLQPRVIVIPCRVDRSFAPRKRALLRAGSLSPITLTYMFPRARVLWSAAPFRHLAAHDYSDAVTSSAAHPHIPIPVISTARFLVSHALAPAFRSSLLMCSPIARRLRHPVRGVEVISCTTPRRSGSCLACVICALHVRYHTHTLSHHQFYTCFNVKPSCTCGRRCAVSARRYSAAPP